MRIKKFIADNIKEGKALVIKELGDDAVILSSRTMINPATGKDYIEIVAAIDDVKQAKNTRIVEQIKIDKNETLKNELLGEEIFLKEISDIKNTLALINHNIKYRFANSLSPIFAKLYEKLIINGLPENLALEIVAKVSNININVEYSPAINYAKEIIAERINIIKPIETTNDRKTLFFVGNTGCGKTSSLVKIAVVAKLINNSNILIVSADTYKIGGAEQLQTMAAIVGIPFRAAYSPEDLKNILDSAIEYNMIFIDTIGRNHNDKENIDELYSYYEIAQPDLTYIVLNAISSYSNAIRILQRFSHFSPNAVILSKIDEADSLGAIIPAIWEAQIPIAYLTKGQKIPDDIEPADKLKIAELMLTLDE